MTNNNRERVIKLTEGQKLYIVSPPHPPIVLFWHAPGNDWAFDDVEPQDVPAIEENASTIPDPSEIFHRPGPEITATEILERKGDTKIGEELIDHAIESAQSNIYDLALRDGHTEQCANRMAYEDGKCCCAKLGFTPTLPEQFNRTTEQQHVEVVKQTLGPLNDLLGPAETIIVDATRLESDIPFDLS